MPKYFFAIILLALTACVGSFAPKMDVSHRVIGVRDFLVRGEKAPAGYAAYGYLVFSGRHSTPVEKERYASICRAYLSRVEPSSEYADFPANTLANTFWPLTRAISPYSTDCNAIVENYDYVTAEKIAAVSNISPTHRGPFIVAWTVPHENAALSTRPRLVLDLSTLPNEDMNYAIRVWKENVATNPHSWTQGRMNRTIILAAFQYFISKYGNAIIEFTQS